MKVKVKKRKSFYLLKEGEERCPLDLLQNWGGTEPNRTGTFMVLNALANDWRKSLAFSCDEFRRPRFDAIRQVVLETTTQKHRKKTATAGSDVVQSGHPIFDDFFQHLWPYIGNNTANVVFQMVKRLWLIRRDQ
ncbi:hypothetical protein TNCV_2551191 [Trichonephila clavipes]|nr:hypothetical protein TNCV_2551191 [Trichonephila clavipes]